MSGIFFRIWFSYCCCFGCSLGSFCDNPFGAWSKIWLVHVLLITPYSSHNAWNIACGIDGVDGPSSYKYLFYFLKCFITCHCHPPPVGQRFIKLAKSPMSPPLAFPFTITASGISLLSNNGEELSGAEINEIHCQG